MTTAKLLAQTVRLVTEGLVEETFRQVAELGETLTAAQFEVLRFIDRHERPTIGEVAEALHISSAAATKSVSGLEERARPLVQRSRGADRRTVRLATTAAGNALVNTVRATFTGRLEAVLERMGSAEQARLEEGLRAFLAAALVTAGDCDAACLRCGIDHSESCLVHLAEVGLVGPRERRC
ncbi:MAG: winged helix DNA-binding protein [Fimbriimonadaceae bacterium]|nr:winged helix DNA-binding protein [Fimbriimonadaceae bacterium]